MQPGFTIASTMQIALWEMSATTGSLVDFLFFFSFFFLKSSSTIGEEIVLAGFRQTQVLP